MALFKAKNHRSWPRFITVHIPGATHTDANSINSRGDIIVEDFTDSGGNTHGYLLRK